MIRPQPLIVLRALLAMMTDQMRRHPTYTRDYKRAAEAHAKIDRAIAARLATLAPLNH